MTEQEDRKACRDCHEERPVEEFFSEHWGKEVAACRGCRQRNTERGASRRADLGAEGIRDMNLRAKYGIPPEEYDALRVAQSFRCAICGLHEDEIAVSTAGRPRLDGKPTAQPLKLVVDHCHKTKIVRGLLCHRCNSAIGHLRDSPATIRAALAYVERGGHLGPAGGLKATGLTDSGNVAPCPGCPV